MKLRKVRMLLARSKNYIDGQNLSCKMVKKHYSVISGDNYLAESLGISFSAMRVRTKIVLSNAAVFLGVACLCLINVQAIRHATTNRVQLKESYEQLQHAVNVDSFSNRLSEQVAEMVILGVGEFESVRTASRTLKESLDQQTAAIEAELQGIVNDSVERQRELGELSRVAELHELNIRILSASKRIQSHLRSGDQQSANKIYRYEIEDILDEKMDYIIESLLVDEREEIDVALERSDALSLRSLYLVLSVAGIVALTGMANAYLVNQTIARPLARLSDATDAVTRGEFAYEIKDSSPDEFGELAKRFNLMIRQLAVEKESVKQAHAMLEGEVAERTAELSTANRQLRDVDASRSEFLADISHELRTPLTVLRGQAEIVLRNPGSEIPELRSTLERIVAKADQIGRLVEDLLLLSRSENGSIGIETAEVKLQDVIADVLMDSQQLSRRSRITIAARQPEEPVFVNGDAQRLRQAVLIGLDNAIKYAPERSTVAVDLVSDDDQAHIIIKDEGAGFREKELESAFERFYRGRTSDGRSSRGLGLGLSIAKWITDQHQGTIGITNAPGKGAVIRMSLPLLNLEQ